MILFLGEESRGFFLNDLILETGQEVLCTGIIPHIQDAKISMTNRPYECIVIDITQFINDSDEIAAVIKTVITTTATPVLIYAPGIQEKSEILIKLSEIGIVSVINSITPTKQREQYKYYINNYSVNSPQEDLTVTQETNQQQQQTSTQSKPFKSISLCGACRRIGTTTQAIQIIKFLQFNGYKAAYIEMNNTGFVLQLAQVYSDIEVNVPQNKKITYKNIDFFYSQENLSDILKMNYDYFIFDYGSADDPQFNAISFIEKDIPIICCGSAPNEWSATNAVISKTLLNDAYYIFNFCDVAEHSDIRELMQEKAKKTIFSGYTPDFAVFTADRNNLYKQIINVENLNAYKPARRSLFRRKRRSYE